jgi:hypothetical protein
MPEYYCKPPESIPTAAVPQGIAAANYTLDAGGLSSLDRRLMHVATPLSFFWCDALILL